MISGRLLFGNISPSTNPSLSSPNTKQAVNIPEFYRELSKKKGAFSIIEYPVIVQDSHNPFHYYQSYHQKKVLNGYLLSHRLKKQWKTETLLKSRIWSLDLMLGRLESNRFDFSGLINIFDNFIDLHNIRLIRKCGAKYIILHKDIRKEAVTIKEGRQSEMNSVDLDIWHHISRFSSYFREYYKRYFDEPVYENESLTVFKVQ